MTNKEHRWFAVQYDGLEIFCNREHFTLPWSDKYNSYDQYFNDGLALVRLMNKIESEILNDK